MLRHNLDISDGLYNGARGDIVAIEWPQGSPDLPLPPELLEKKLWKFRRIKYHQFWSISMMIVLEPRVSQLRSMERGL